MSPTHQRLEATLRATFAPSVLRIEDESDQHAGHAGAAGGAHFRVTITAASFEGRSLIERHRMVYAALAAEMKGAVHALALTTRAPGEP